MKKYTLGRALDIWRRSKEYSQTDSNLEKYLKGALKKYVLAGIDPRAANLKTKEFVKYCDNFSVDKLDNALDVFEQESGKAVESNQISDGTRRNYRSALTRFIKWMQGQVWWSEIYGGAVASFTPRHPGSSRKNGRRMVQGSVLGRDANSPYSLKEEQISKTLASEIEEFIAFRLAGGKKQLKRRTRQIGELSESRRPKLEKISCETAEGQRKDILLFLGWYINIKKCEISGVNLTLLTDINLLEDYTNWSTEEKNNSHTVPIKIVRAGIAIAKWLNYEKSCRRNWSDIPLILDLRDLASEFEEENELEKKENNEEKWRTKNLTHEEARMIVQYLYQWCARRRKYYKEKENGSPKLTSISIRKTPSIVRAWQVYLIVKLLVYCPVRQQEIRELEFGKTLLRQIDANSNPYYVVITKNHKNFAKTRKARHYKIPSIITPDLDAWLFTWRPIVASSLKTLENWLEFWSQSYEDLELKRSKLEEAKQGNISESTKKYNRHTLTENYIPNLERKIVGLENRITAYPMAKENFESHNFVFFLTPNATPESFGKPTTLASIWNTTTVAIAKASKALFGEGRTMWTNPHAFRHIGEKHIRKIHGNAKEFGMYIGHSEEMGDEYADQITSEYEVTESMADNWWEE